MLTRAALAVALALVGIVVAASAAAAEGPVQCVPGTQICFVDVSNPGDPGTPLPSGSGGTGGSERVCVIDRTGEVIPCSHDVWGWFNGSDDCYYVLADPQPPAGELVWEGNYPDGAVYLVTCLDGVSPGTSGGWTWLPTPPPGYGGITVTPAELAARAVDQMRLAGPAIGTTVAADRTGLVGVPVWLWTDVSPTTWGPNSATASVPGLSVTATAQVSKIVWDMGDGSTVVCPNAGTPWFEGGIESPTCDHVFEAPSADQPNDAYTVTATSTWDVTWTGGGTSGSLTVTRTSSTTVRIGELQVLVTS
ncbi:hypothetical protein [Cellulomonas hominis]